MPTLRQIVDQKCFEGEIFAYGTSEGVSKAWDERGRGKAAREAEKAASIPEHIKAGNFHEDMAQEEKDHGRSVSSQAHTTAANSHWEAVDAHNNKDSNARAFSRIARSDSSRANKLTGYDDRVAKTKHPL